MVVWRVFCIRNTMLKELYFDCTADVHSDLRKLAEEGGSALEHWDFDQHDLICFDLDTYPIKDNALVSVEKLRVAPAPSGWQIVQ